MNKITMSTEKFHTICKQFNNNYVHVEITSVGNQIDFIGKGDGGKMSKTYTDTKSKNSKNEKGTMVQGSYELKNLMNFSKCNKLSEIINIYMTDDYPLVLAIPVSNLGVMHIFITPINPDVTS